MITQQLALKEYQATRAYSIPPDFPEQDERRTTNDYGLVHLAMTATKQHVFHAIIQLLAPREAVLVGEARKVFAAQIEQAAEAEVHRILQSLPSSRAHLLLPSPPFASNVRYLHYLQQLSEALAGRAPRGFRFAVINAADKPAPSGVETQIFNAAKGGKLDELLGLCHEWAGHNLINAKINRDYDEDSEGEESEKASV